MDQVHVLRGEADMVVHHIHKVLVVSVVVAILSTMRRIVRNLLKELGFVNVQEAEDGVDALGKLRRLLEGAGLAVLQVNDGNEALAQLEARPEVAVLITDLEMPNKDGFELIADVHGSLATEDLPVIAITGHDELHGRVGQIEGVYGIFKKPWNDRELLKRVESLVHLRSAASRRARRVAPGA